MDAPDQTMILLNGALNVVNLALTAWVLRMSQDAKAEVKRNTRISTRAARSATTVKRKTNGVLSRLLERLEHAARRIQRAEQRLEEQQNDAPKKRKPPRTGKGKGRV